MKQCYRCSAAVFLFLSYLLVLMAGCSSSGSDSPASLGSLGSESGTYWAGMMTREDTIERSVVQAKLTNDSSVVTGDVIIGTGPYSLRGTLNGTAFQATLSQGGTDVMTWFGTMESNTFRGGYEMLESPKSEGLEDPPLFINGSVVLKTDVASTSKEAKYLIHPHLMFAGDNSRMDLLWQTNRDPGACTVSYSTGGGPAQQAAPVILPSRTYNGNGDTTAYIYQCSMTGLTPGAHYSYSIDFNASPSLSLSSDFNAAPPATADSVVFYVCGDTRNGVDETENLEQSMMAASDFKQTLSINTGDWTYHGLKEIYWNDYGGYFDSTYTGHMNFISKVPVAGCEGNHEGYPAPPGTLLDYQYTGQLFGALWAYPFIGGAAQQSTYNLGPYYYSFDYGPIHFTVLDSFTDPALDPAQVYMKSDQLTWLSSDLAGTSKKWKIVFLHIPPYCNKQLSTDDFGTEQTNIQSKVVPILQANGVKLVLAGHQHHYARNEKDGIRYLTLGGAGASLSSATITEPSCVYAKEIYHYARIEIKGNTLKTTITGQKNRGDSFKNYDTDAPDITLP
ncbi:MAG: metallophosphoesterase [Candidatus Eremiobacteraeota bacterium]|nr:metallophosphoesterase [Candidatus Eremiobacteraeota bacterium]